MNFYQKIATLVSVIGPGIITANVNNDAGGIAIYSLAGAHLGYKILWSLIPICLMLIIVQEMVSRMGVISGKGLSDLIREKYGVRISFYIILLLVLVNLGNILANFSGIAASVQIFGMSKYIFLPILVFLVWLIVIRGTYKIVEKIFLIACLFYVSYIISGFLAKPSWSEVMKSLLIPKFEFKLPYTTMLLGMVGSTIAPWMQFYLQANIIEKGIKKKDVSYSKIEVILGCVMAIIIAFFIIVACASTLHKEGIKIETADQAALALEPLAGKYCSTLFAVGLLNASLFAASILPLSTAFCLCESIGWEVGLNKSFAEAPQFYSIYTLLIVLGAGIVMIPNFPLIKVMFFSQVINGFLLPIILFLIIFLINDKDIMGNYTNSKTYNIICHVSVVLLGLLGLLNILFAIFVHS